ncbi:ABC transporter ATP-binding protein [Methylocapsa sp. S129]|uniref:ABC transporter ATP-binding protein n=1 Tax=Methylocapsa sp. S129 TaxID=1641869 RepID=UPI00131BFFEF|nr:ABC transporter ATP-binding protein [Methylocapsa sp. S129]
MAPGAPHLVVRQVSKRFGAAHVLDRVDLTIARGELVTLLGPSGCGKTTLLRLIAGLESPDAGSVELAGRDITRVPPHRRNVGVVFQSYALFPHLTVYGNVAFGLKSRGRSRGEIDAAVGRALSLVHLEHLGARRIAALSGGQQQRVALARAIAVEPDVLLFDEALSALDRKLREEMQVELRRLLREVGATAIFVTHDQDEALTMSDRVAVMFAGRIEQVDEPRIVYARPATLFTLGFVGLSTRVSGIVAGSNNGRVEVDTAVGRLSAIGNFLIGSPVVVAVRPEHVRAAPETAGNCVAGRVRSIVFHGSNSLVEVDAGAATTLLAQIPNDVSAPPRVGDEIRLCWPVAETFAFPMPEAGA